ncbi:MAG: PAS domain S-box protein [Methanococcaceae archaeon]
MIEDNLGDARYISELFNEVNNFKFTLEHAFRLSTGLERLSKNTYDVILLDVNLPDCRGFEGLEAIIAQGITTPIIMLTGYEDDIIGMQSVQKGAQDYLIKLKVDGELLIKSIHYAVERKRFQEMLRESEELFRATFEQAGIGIVHMDTEGKFIRANSTFAGLLSYTPEELQQMAFPDITPPEDIKVISEDLQKLTRREVEHCRTYGQFFRKDASIIKVRLTISLVHDCKSVPKYFILYIESI